MGEGRRGKAPPGPSRLRGFSHVGLFLRNRADFVHEIWNEYGDVCRFQMGFFDIYLVNRPDLVQHVFMNHEAFPKSPTMNMLKLIIGDGLLVSKGEQHRRQRRLMQPAFQKRRIATYADIMIAEAARQGEHWKEGREVNIHREMMSLALEIVARTLFHSSADGLTERVSKALNALLPVINRIAQPTGALRMILPSPTNFRLLRARNELNKMIYHIIESRREDEQDHGDLLSVLLSARDDEGDGTGMTDKEIRDEAMTMFLAGHETTAIALTWTWYLLATNPDARRKLHDELDTVLGGRMPTMDDVDQLTYTRMVVAESLRLYPPVYLTDRMPAEDWDTGEYIIPKGKYLFLSPYLMHRHPEFYPDPERFDPERWTPEQIASRPKFSYFPFGGGLRTCIGEQFAWTEMILVVATLAQRWNLELVPGQHVETEALVTLRPKGGIQMVTRERASKAAPVTS